jgi:hypothetical protein
MSEAVVLRWLICDEGGELGVMNILIKFFLDADTSPMYL